MAIYYSDKKTESLSEIYDINSPKRNTVVLSPPEAEEMIQILFAISEGEAGSFVGAPLNEIILTDCGDISDILNNLINDRYLRVNFVEEAPIIYPTEKLLAIKFDTK